MTGVSRVKALVYALIALGVGALSYFVGVGSWLGQRAEASVLGASEYNTHPPAPLSLVSIPALIIAFVVIALIASRVRGFLRAVWIVLFAGIAIAASQVLKQELLDRPGLFELDLENTFPSGHMTVFTVVVAGLIWAFPVGGRGVVALFGAVLLGTVSWQLLEYGWHRPSDVIGAQALGLVAFALAALLWPTRRRGGSGFVRRGSAGVTRILGMILTVAGIALVLGGVVLMLLAAWLTSDVLMLAASQVAVLGVSAISTRALMTLAA